MIEVVLKYRKRVVLSSSFLDQLQQIVAEELNSPYNTNLPCGAAEPAGMDLTLVEYGPRDRPVRGADLVVIVQAKQFPGRDMVLQRRADAITDRLTPLLHHVKLYVAVSTHHMEFTKSYKSS